MNAEKEETMFDKTTKGYGQAVQLYAPTKMPPEPDELPPSGLCVDYRVKLMLWN